MTHQELPDWISTKEAMERTGYSRPGIVKLCNTGEIRARKFGTAFAIHWPTLKAYAEAHAGASKHDPRRNPEWKRSPDAGRPRRESDGDE